MPVNNIGVSQGSALSALRFIIYIRDMARDYQTMNDQQRLPHRTTIQVDPETHARELTNPTSNQPDKSNKNMKYQHLETTNMRKILRAKGRRQEMQASLPTTPN